MRPARSPPSAARRGAPGRAQPPEPGRRRRRRRRSAGRRFKDRSRAGDEVVERALVRVPERPQIAEDDRQREHPEEALGDGLAQEGTAPADRGPVVVHDLDADDPAPRRPAPHQAHHHPGIGEQGQHAEPETPRGPVGHRLGDGAVGGIRGLVGERVASADRCDGSGDRGDEQELDEPVDEQRAGARAPGCRGQRHGRVRPRRGDSPGCTHCVRAPEGGWKPGGGGGGGGRSVTGR